MLDQNTDRMWYVIGAVLVGAAIILIANGTLPQMFASVTNTFEDATKNGMVGVNMAVESYNNLININTATKGHWVDQETGELRTDRSGYAHSVTDYIPVEAGKSYSLYSTTGNLINPRMVWFDKNHTYISGVIKDVQYGVDQASRIQEIAPTNAKYVRISAGDVSNEGAAEYLADHRYGLPYDTEISHWVFIQL